MYYRTLISAAALTLLTLTRAFAQDPQQGRTVSTGISERQADDILNELRAIRQLLEKQATSRPSVPSGAPVALPTGKLKMGGGFQLGSSEAPITMVEFTDYQCPFCRQFHDTTFANLRKNYVDSGKLKIVIRDFPLVDIHPNAMRAAEAAHCAGDQGKFLNMHDLLFTDPNNLSERGLIAYAEALKLDVAKFRVCVQSERHKTEIQKDLQDALSLGLNGTPSFLIGRSGGSELSGTIIVGAQPLSVFETTLEEAFTSH